MRTKPTQPNRVNWRNEALTLRALLKLAIQALWTSGTVVPPELRRWLDAQKKVMAVTGKPRAEITVQMVQEHINEVGGLDG